MKNIKYIIIGIISAIAFSCRTNSSVVNNSSTSSEEQSNKGIISQEIYRASYQKINDLVHTKLELVPDWSKKEIFGKATITLHPHLYSTDSLVLNARGMEIHTVSVVNKNGSRDSLNYNYSEDKIYIKLDTIYSKAENYTVFIEYTSKPETLIPGGSAAITKDKGFYFINADGTDPDKPRQFWTQGETESNSAWFPTIEAPNQKMTQEIYITIDSNFKTLSNGLLLSSVTNEDGTRTDYWKQSLPAAPYLAMVAAGDYAVVKDKWRNIEINYYVDKPYEKYARMIFGHTPEMIEFFSKKLGVDYPWEKYSQIVVHDYVSGAMENTTAVVHGTNMQQDSRDYKDGNYENYISHELFHHWFGDLVTCESWANMTLNEGFANYGQYLWTEYKFGRDQADLENQSDLAVYFYSSQQDDPPLIRYQYDDKEDVYDAISYNKGGRVLHMLRKYVGDEAFFASLNEYLESHKFSTVEIHDLRLAFEKVTGEDLNWFFNQWYFRNGYPSVTINLDWDEDAKKETITLEQTQDLRNYPLYQLPIDVDFYVSGSKQRKRIVFENSEQEFVFDLPAKPDLVNVDAEKMLLWKKKEKKSDAEWLFQYYHAPLYLDRFEALKQLSASYNLNTPEARLVMDALDDPCWKIRMLALDNIGNLAANNPDTTKIKLLDMAQSDSNANVRETVYKTLNQNYKYTDISPAIQRGLDDSSYLVVARAFKIIEDKEPELAISTALKLEKDSSDEIFVALSDYYSEHNAENKNPFYQHALRKTKGWSRYEILKNYGIYLEAHEGEILDQGIENLFELGKTTSSDRFRKQVISRLEKIQSDLLAKIEDHGNTKRERSGSQNAEINNAKVNRLRSHADKLSDMIEELKKING